VNSTNLILSVKVTLCCFVTVISFALVHLYLKDVVHLGNHHSKHHLKTLYLPLFLYSPSYAGTNAASVAHPTLG